MLFCNVKSLKTYFSVVAILAFTSNGIAQTKPDKVAHAEPLYFDLVRDLGAKKGEKEINVGANFTNIANYIPINKPTESCSPFLRIIYEP